MNIDSMSTTPVGLARIYVRLVSVDPDSKRVIAGLLTTIDELTVLLRDLEWSRLNDGRGVTQVQCPACFALQSRGTGHNAFCGLEAAISKAEGR